MHADIDKDGKEDTIKLEDEDNNTYSFEIIGIFEDNDISDNNVISMFSNSANTIITNTNALLSITDSNEDINASISPTFIIDSYDNAEIIEEEFYEKGLDKSYVVQTNEELANIVKRTSKVMSMNITDEAALELAKRSRKTPRIANRLFKRVRDFALVEGDGLIDLDITLKALDRLNVDAYGLDNIDIEYLEALINKFNGGPVGVETISTAIGEEISTIEDVVEPFLLQEGFIKRTRSGRVATEFAYKHLGIDHNMSLF